MSFGCSWPGPGAGWGCGASTRNLASNNRSTKSPAGRSIATSCTFKRPTAPHNDRNRARHARTSPSAAFRPSRRASGARRPPRREQACDGTRADPPAQPLIESQVLSVLMFYVWKCLPKLPGPRLQTWVTRTWLAWGGVECRDEPGLVLGTHDELTHPDSERTEAHPLRPIRRDLDQPGTGAIDESGASPVVDSAGNADSERTTQFAQASVQWPGRCNGLARDRGSKCPAHANVDR